MENGISYLVSYLDGQNVERVKTLKYHSQKGLLIEFLNEYTNKIEIINENRIIRIEGQRENNGIK